MSTPSVNYGWPIPTDGGDDNVWGAELVTALTAIDAQMKTNADAANSLLSNGTFVAQSGPGVVLTGFNAYRIKFQGVIPSAALSLTLQLSFDGGSSWKAGGSDYAYTIQSNNNAVNIAQSGGTTGFKVTANSISTTAARPNNIDIDIIGPTASGFGVGIDTSARYFIGSTQNQFDVCSGACLPNYGTPTNARLLCSTGNISGSYAVYGVPGF